MEEVGSGHVIVSREFRQKRFRQNRASLGEKLKHPKLLKYSPLSEQLTFLIHFILLSEM